MFADPDSVGLPPGASDLAAAAGLGIEAGLGRDGDALLDGAVTDGPFAESKELVGGYSMVQAKNLDEAVKLTKDCPMFAAGGTVEVRELANVGKPEESA